MINLKVKFYYAIWFEVGSKLVADRFEAGPRPASNQLRTIDSVMEFGLPGNSYRAADSHL